MDRFINPPFVTASVGRGNTDLSKNDVSMTPVRNLMNKEDLGEASREHDEHRMIGRPVDAPPPKAPFQPL